MGPTGCATEPEGSGAGAEDAVVGVDEDVVAAGVKKGVTSRRPDFSCDDAGVAEDDVEDAAKSGEAPRSLSSSGQRIPGET